MTYRLTTAMLGLALFGCQPSGEPATSQADPVAQPTVKIVSETVAPRSGIDLAAIDESTRPQDDFYQYVNGTWLQETKIPPDKSNYGSFNIVADQTEEQLHQLIVELSSDPSTASGVAAEKVRDYYLAYQDSEAANRAGLTPIDDLLKAIDQAVSHHDILRLFAELSVYQVKVPVLAQVAPDLNDSSRYAVYLEEGGLTLPDRDYYLEDDEQYVAGRSLYREYVTGLLNFAGFEADQEAAEHLLALETRLAEPYWTREANRDPTRSNNPMTVNEVQSLSALIDWRSFLSAHQVAGRDQYIVSQPSYLAELDRIFIETPVGTWKDYLRFQTLHAFAPVLTDASFDLWFAFELSGLQGVPEAQPRWKRALESMDENMGFLLGQMYVDRYFPPEAKERMVVMVDNLLQAYHDSISDLDWMGDETRQAALEKLGKFLPQIAYPDHWRDYTGLLVGSENLVTNVRSAREFEARRQLNHLDEPVDRTEWGMTPQTVNAGYSPQKNRITFPAAVLQPPFFNLEADDAVNYGAIGAGIGHEIGHGFDDEGRKYDGDGNLRDWWTPEDAARFEVLRQKLEDQYNRFEVIDGLTINGEFTSGENIGDLGGLSIAYRAYRMSLNGAEAPVIDGLTGDQRFFMGFAQIWRRLYRDEELKRRLTIDPHSPSKARTNVILSNIPAFYEAFDVQPGDGMYLAPEDRVRIW